VLAVEAELPVELLDDPQPAISASAPHVIAAAMPVFIGRGPFSTSSCNRTIAYGGDRGRRWPPGRRPRVSSQAMPTVLVMARFPSIKAKKLLRVLQAEPLRYRTVRRRALIA
jgi:hypothetical protein